MIENVEFESLEEAETLINFLQDGGYMQLVSYTKDDRLINPTIEMKYGRKQALAHAKRLDEMGMLTGRAWTLTAEVQ